MFTYLWHVTFFGGCMAVFGYMEQRGKHGVTCRPVLPVSQSGQSDWVRSGQIRSGQLAQIRSGSSGELRGHLPTRLTVGLVRLVAGRTGQIRSDTYNYGASLVHLRVVCTGV